MKKYSVIFWIAYTILYGVLVFYIWKLAMHCALMTYNKHNFFLFILVICCVIIHTFVLVISVYFLIKYLMTGEIV